MFVVNGEKVGSDIVTVESGETKTASLSYLVKDEGDYVLEAGNESLTLNVEEDKPTTGYISNYWWIIPVIIAAIVSYLIGAKQGKGKEPIDEEQSDETDDEDFEEAVEDATADEQFDDEFIIHGRKLLQIERISDAP